MMNLSGGVQFRVKTAGTPLGPQPCAELKHGGLSAGTRSVARGGNGSEPILPRSRHSMQLVLHGRVHRVS